MYPEAYKFISESTLWGCLHEKRAHDHYSKQMLKSHQDFSVNDSGLCVNSKWPHLGASPDGLVTCYCCNKEIKCPYCHKDDITELTNDKHFYLKED